MKSPSTIKINYEKTHKLIVSCTYTLKKKSRLKKSLPRVIIPFSERCCYILYTVFQKNFQSLQNALISLILFAVTFLSRT